MTAPRLALAYALDLLFGDPEWLPHPVRWFGAMIRAGERWLRHEGRAPGEEILAGAALTGAVVSVAWVMGRPRNAGWQILLASTALATRCLSDEASAVIRALEADDLALARQRLSRIVGRDTAHLSESEIARAVIETLAESACDGIVAPLFWLAAGGVSGAMAYKAVNTLDSMIGHWEPPYRYFGRVAARLDDAANFIPARLTALGIVAAAKVQGLDARRAREIWLLDGDKHASPNAGQCEAAMAGALGVRLGGMNSYEGQIHDAPHLCAEGRPASVRDARAALSMVAVVSALAFWRGAAGGYGTGAAEMTEHTTRHTTAHITAHGGDVWQVAEELGIPASEILDFSANINPRGLPPRAMARLAKDAADSRLLGLYPDPSARRLRKALSEQLGVPTDAIAVGPGAEALLAPILRCEVGARRALVPVPAFSEYRRVCAQQDVEFVPFPLDRAECFRVPVDRFCACIESEAPGMVLLNNPHNPSGAMLDTDEIERVADSTISFLTTLILDEAFIDYVPEASLVRQAVEHPALIVIRSLTKFYGCPALRVGYAVAHPETVRRVMETLPTWSVTQLAMEALAEAVGDREYADASVRENTIERGRMAESLGALGLMVFPSAANYLLVELGAGMPAASELRSRLIRKHRILIRNCDSYEGLEAGRYVRVAVRSGEENGRLVLALGEELRSR